MPYILSFSVVACPKICYNGKNTRKGRMPVRYDIILADIDNTLFDFDADAREALEKTFRHFGFPWNETERQRYFAINHQLWADFELGKIEKSAIYTTRFRRYLDAAGLTGDSAEIT